MDNFFEKYELEAINEYKKNGYIIRDIEEKESLIWIKDFFNSKIKSYLSIDEIDLNFIHEKISLKNLNDFRLKLINDMQSEKLFRYHYYKISKKFLDIIVGNELVMQKSINLSIQLPYDDSSLLPIHADVWSGDSPFEVVAWLPLVNCYASKSMYLLPPKHSEELINNFDEFSGKSSSEIFEKVKDKVEWLEIDFGKILIFDQSLPHGNITNIVNETRWSMNCRFKSIYSPYGDKKLGEFFQPITLKPASEIGMKYNLPNIKN